jgi:hypothetical protein
MALPPGQGRKSLDWCRSRSPATAPADRPVMPAPSPRRGHWVDDLGGAGRSASGCAGRSCDDDHRDDVGVGAGPSESDEDLTVGSFLARYRGRGGMPAEGAHVRDVHVHVLGAADVPVPRPGPCDTYSGGWSCGSSIHDIGTPRGRVRVARGDGLHRTGSVVDESLQLDVGKRLDSGPIHTARPRRPSCDLVIAFPVPPRSRRDAAG